MNIWFWIKSLTHLLSPIKLGYERELARHKSLEKFQKLDKTVLKRVQNDDHSYEKDPGFRYRKFTDYAEYVDYQKLKFDRIITYRGGFSRRVIFRYRRTFYRRFKQLLSILPDKQATMICLGARQGTEVEVLRDLGYKKAYGIDLNPGPNNPHVRPGDFMHVDAVDSSVDFIYSNSIDHSYDLDEFFKEQSRILKPDGIAIFDIALQKMGLLEAVDWDNPTLVVRKIMSQFQNLIHAEVDGQWMWVMVRGKNVQGSTIQPPLSKSAKQ